MPKGNKVAWPGWETVRLIGRGSFGAVYEIQRDVLGDVEKAALKVISIPQNDGDIEEMYGEGYDDESITSTFQSHLKSIVAEYSLMRKMNGSANIVNCDDIRYIQHDDGIGWDIFIKMELLTPLMKALPADIPEEMVIKVARDICVALELCKEHGIVHRDIKPQNIFVSSRGDYKLGDFGIAKTVEKTMGGTKIGTYKYMAPEVYNNQPYGTGADIYSLGLVLYWLLNEKRMPFLPLPPAKMSVGMEEAARQRRFSGEPLPVPKNGSERLKNIVLKACAFDPKERYASATEMLKALNGLRKKTQPITIPAVDPISTPTPQPVPIAKPVEDKVLKEQTVDILLDNQEKKEAQSDKAIPVAEPVIVVQEPKPVQQTLPKIEPVVATAVLAPKNVPQPAPAPQNVSQTTPASKPEAKRVRTPSKKKKVWIIVAIIAVLAVALIVMLTRCGATPNTTEEKKTIVGIAINSSPNKMQYYVGDTLDTTGLSLIVNYSDHSTEVIRDGFFCNLTKLDKEGAQRISITYRGCQTSVIVNVVKRTEQNVPEKGDGVMTHAEYVQAEEGSLVTVEMYIQAKMTWAENYQNTSIYGQNLDGAYFLFRVPCSKEEYDQLMPGTKIRVTGYKAQYGGLVEIKDASYQILDGYWIADPLDVTALLGSDSLIEHMNKRVSFTGMTVEAYTENGEAFMYKWDGTGTVGDDLYFKASINGKTYTFVVEHYLCGANTEVYEIVSNLQVGDVIDMEGFLHWFNGPEPNITSITVKN